MTRPVLAFLEMFQRQFSTMLRNPLDRGTGMLRATPGAYPDDLRARVCARGIDPAERLAVYNRQYWFRLFGVLQDEHRLTTALLGAWTFNGVAQRFLVANAPVGHDLATVADGFAEFVGTDVPATGLDVRGDNVPRDAIVEAVRIDVAFRNAMREPQEQPLRLTAANAPHLPHAHLVWSRTFTLLDETWPLIALRHELPAPLGEHRAPLPPPHPDGPRAWVISRTPNGLRAAPVPPLHADLLRLLGSHSIGDALAMLEARGSVDAVAAHAQRWFAEGIELGFWTATEAAP